MNMPKMFVVIAVVWVVYAIVNAFSGSEKPLKKSLLGILSGIAALAAVHLLSPYTGVPVTISVMSLLVAAVGGIPGATLILVLNMFF